MAAAEAMVDPNPFIDSLRFERRIPACTIVIFGANGDLAKRKLLPALYSLAHDRRLSAGFAVAGNSRTPLSDEDFRARMKQSVKDFGEQDQYDEEVWQSFERGLYYVPGDVKDPAYYNSLKERLEAISSERHTGDNVLFYLSTQPSLYGPIVRQLEAAGLARSENGGWRRIVVEKPFGHDLASARELSRQIQGVFEESEIYRIDHYLGKETVQNILAFRFANGIFEPLWNRRYVRQVQITAAETIGVEDRGGYYEESGALRDMVQNHLLQVLATMAMEPPARFEAEAVRNEKSKVLESIRPMSADDVSRYAVAGQYSPGRVGGTDLAAYRQERGVDAESQTDTYAAVTFFVDNWRWAGVPFYVRSGKRLAKRVTEISIEFASAPHVLFSEQSPVETPNLLILRIQPSGGISLRFDAKKPGEGMQLRGVSMDFHYGSSFGVREPSAYETLLLDAIAGDGTLYSRQDMVEASWAAVEPIVEVWKNQKHDFPNYAAGSWGPGPSDQMLNENRHSWRTP